MYSRQYEDRIGIEVDGQKIFIAAENAFPINWEARLIHGKKRKEMIRKAAINNMYYCFRAPFVDNKPWRDRAKLTST